MAKKKPMDNRKFVYVEWVDSASKFGWKDTPDCKVAVTKCYSVGELIDETKDGLTVAQNATTASSFCPYGNLTSIPKVAIIKIKQLKLGK